MNGRDLTGGDFNFVLTLIEAQPLDGVILPSNTSIPNNLDGAIIFSPIQFTKAGTYKFTISQTIPDGASGGNPIDGILYDESIFTIVVDVKNVGNELVYNITYYNNEMNEINTDLTFINKYKQPSEPSEPSEPSA